jgi:filamentous hemagglutinin
VQTLITHLSGQQVDITVGNHTEIKGAVIAAVDSEGKDNGQLSLSTNTLNASSLNSTVDNTSRSLGVESGEVSSLDYQKDGEFEKVKSLATLGSGDIRITDSEGSDTRMLNTDIENTEVAIYDLESHQGLSGELDTRLLTEDGRKQIAEDWVKTEMIGNTIGLIATTDRVGITDLFSETEKYYQTYEAVKEQVRTSPELALMLQDPNLTPAQ